MTGTGVMLGIFGTAVEPELSVPSSRAVLERAQLSPRLYSRAANLPLERFEKEGLEIPFAQTEVYLRNVDALGRALRGLVPAEKIEDESAAMVRTTKRARDETDVGEAG